MKGLVAPVAGLLLALTWEARGEEAQPSRHLLAFKIDGVKWQDLHRLDRRPSPSLTPTAGFNPWGFNVEFGYQYRLPWMHDFDLLLGANGGVFSFKVRDLNETSPTSPYCSQPCQWLMVTGAHLTPSFQVRYGRGVVRPFAGVGAGYYYAEIGSEYKGTGPGLGMGSTAATQGDGEDFSGVLSRAGRDRSHCSSLLPQ